MPKKIQHPQFDEKLVFTYDPKFGIPKVGGEPMDEQRIRNLQEEIKFIEKSDWWQLVTNTLPKKSQEIAFVTSTKFDDLKTAKVFLRVVFLIKELNARIKIWKPKEVKVKVPNSPIQH